MHPPSGNPPPRIKIPRPASVLSTGVLLKYANVYIITTTMYVHKKIYSYFVINNTRAGRTDD